MYTFYSILKDRPLYRQSQGMHRRQGKEIERGRCVGFRHGSPSPSVRNAWGGWSQCRSQGGPWDWWRAPGGAPCLEHRSYESGKAAIHHPAAGAIQDKAEHGTSTHKEESSVVPREECRGVRPYRHDESGHNALAEPKPLSDVMGKNNTRKERQVQDLRKGCRQAACLFLCEQDALKP